MKTRLFWWLLTGLMLAQGVNPARAQAVSDTERRYKAAVRLVQTGQYERAKTELSAVAMREGSLAPYATYYLAVVAFRQKNYTQTRLTLKQLTDRYPQWRKLDDAHYLFACAAMETGQYEDALTRLQRIGDTELRADIDKLERYFLGRITDLGRLKAMQREFPGNRNVALALINQIQRGPAEAADLELSDKLAAQFDVPLPPAATRPAAVTTTFASNTLVTGDAPRTTTTTRAAPARNRNKGYFNVAVMFPFKVDEFDAERRGRANQYVYDLYEGIKLAKAKLQEEGVTVNLFAYDIDNDVNKTLDVLNSSAIAQTDLIIGPLYAEPNRLITAYAGQNYIPVVNPIATSSELIANQPTAFLAQPSLAQQAEKAVAFARTLPALRRAAVYFGASRKDSLLAVACQTELKKQGVQVVEFRKMALTAEATASGMMLTETNKPGCVFLMSSKADDGPRLLDALKRRSVNSAVIATASAFDAYRNSLSTFTRRELYLLYPDYIDPTRPEVTAFEETYLAKRNIIPSVYASQGYDIMLFFGRLLAKNTLMARSRVDFKSDSTDYVLSGFDYTLTNDNQVVPIVKFEGGRFVKVNE